MNNVALLKCIALARMIIRGEMYLISSFKHRSIDITCVFVVKLKSFLKWSPFPVVVLICVKYFSCIYSAMVEDEDIATTQIL